MIDYKKISDRLCLKKSFFQEEEKYDYLIDEKRKKLWSVLLDIVCQLDVICKKYNLRYFITGGTLLGAVRHKGFIPWDDDLDVAMLRDDYEILLKHADEFVYPFFLQTPDTDSNYYYSFAKLCHEETTYCSKMFCYQGFHAGVSIDIFPIDKWDYAKGKEIYDQINYLNRENSTFMRMKNPYLDEGNRERVRNWSGINPLEAYNKIQTLAQTFKNEETHLLSNAVITIWKYGKDIYSESVFEKQIYLEFEGINLPAPIGYEELLRNVYGDYMMLPPKEKRGQWHADTIIDTDKSYSEILKDFR